MSLLYVDTNILIYLLENHPTYSSEVADELETYTKGENELVTSAITITEFLAGTLSADLLTLQTVPKLHFMALDEALAEKAALLQRNTKLSLGDAVHVATAIEAGAESFFTHDKQLAKIAAKFIPIIAPTS